MGYTTDPAMCRVDIWKPSGKWYDTVAVKFRDEDYHSTLIYNAFYNALSDSLGNSYIGCLVTCLKPYHSLKHPVSTVWRGTDEHR